MPSASVGRQPHDDYEESWASRPTLAKRVSGRAWGVSLMMAAKNHGPHGPRSPKHVAPLWLLSVSHLHERPVHLRRDRPRGPRRGRRQGAEPRPDGSRRFARTAGIL